MDYQEAWKFLDDLQFFKIKLGLDSMEGFLESLGQPQAGLDFIHIAGTNGKGSTAVTLLSIMAEAGLKVGMYSSPHLSSVRERFRINDAFIAEDDFARLATTIKAVLNGRQITYFEFTTTLAFLWFAEQHVDLAILEVGMGGRLDATNVITPLLAIITNVTMDHEAYLGDTLPLVAFEKAGVIKPGIPVVTGAGPDESYEVIEAQAKKKQAPLYLLGRDFSWSSEEDTKLWAYDGLMDHCHYERLSCGLNGRHQRDNSALALAALELLKNMAPQKFSVSVETIRAGLQQVRWPGRLELIVLDKTTARPLPEMICDAEKLPNGGRAVERFLLDGAHNPAGVASLKMALEENRAFGGALIGIWASMSDKDIANSLLPIAPLFKNIILTKPESERSATPEMLRQLLPEGIREKAFCRNSVHEALGYAREIAGSDDLICVAGSLYLIGAVREILLGGVLP